MLLVMTLVSACRVPAATGPATQAPVVSATIADVVTHYRQEIPRRMQQEHIPGLALAVVDDQGILWAEGFGYTDWDSQIPVTPDTLFSIQSMSKSFSATAAMVAVQDGLVEPDTPIATYLGDFRVNSIFEEHPEQQITLRMLLSHTAGFAHEAPYGGNFDLPAYSFDRHIDSISDTWLMFPSGTRYSYSNLGIDLAGYLLQERAGIPFTRYVQQKVLSPLGMAQSTLDINDVRARQDRAIGHAPLPLRPPVTSLLIPSGGVWSTAEDMASYLRFHINGGSLDGTRLLREELAETMYTPPNAPARGAGYALGIGVGTRNGARHFQHGGGGFGFNSSMVWYPELKLGAVVLTNAEHPDWYYQLSEELLDSIIDGNPALYAPRAERPVQVEPAYPPSQGESVLADYQLARLIAAQALPEDEATWQRRRAYTGRYVLTQWGIPVLTGEVVERNGELSIIALGETTSMTEVEPGLFFFPSGDTFDVQGQTPAFRNIPLIKAPTRALPLHIAFYGLCGLVFLLPLFFWPVRAVVRRLRSRRTEPGALVVSPSQSRWLVGMGIVAALASLFSLGCLAIVALVPNLVYVPWPRPYGDLTWWQFGVLGLPFVALPLAGAIALLAVLSMKNGATARAAVSGRLLVALVLVAFNLALLL
jgi:CubicO group peptidase (beta-lactamase class C family)